MTTSVRSSPGRIQAIDAVRGFALAGVGVVHMIEQYLGAPMPPEEQALASAGALDKLVLGVDYVFLVGKFYTLFSLLFGLSFFIQMDRAARRGADFRGRFAWRLAVLFGIGFLHHLFYRSDILTTYAVLGLFLIPAFGLADAWLLGLAAALFLGAGRFLAMALVGPTPFPEWAQSPAAPWVRLTYDTLAQGGFADVVAMNALGAYPPLLNFQLGIFGRGYVTLGLFFVGLWLGRRRFFEGALDRTPQLARGLKVSGGLALLMLATTAGVFAVTGPPPESLDSWGFALGLTASDLFSLALAGVWFFGFLAACARPWGAGLLDSFAPYGRMALTNYVAQGVMGSFLYYGFGLGRLGEWRALHAALAAPAFVVIGLVASRLWLSRFRYGPLEWLWRSLTYLRVFPLRRGGDDTEAAVDERATAS
jgi:uncharacterized protein